MNAATRLGRSAYRRMCRVNDLIDRAKDRRDPVALADARTAMSDARCALAAAHGLANRWRCGVTLTVEFVDELPNLGTTATPELVACFAESLRGEPGRWAVYPWSDELAPHSRRSRASDINAGRRGAPAALREGFQAAVRGGVLYVRFAGGDCA